MEALAHQSVEVEKQLQEMRLKLAAGKLDKPSQVKLLSAQLARIKTVLREKQLGISA
ncbi:50S ribosomal protein L29 [Candidatus Woesebacteria bacterium]|nr:50S ribosomal protein L29 [Candidatus Woesebacteria bacterium]